MEKPKLLAKMHDIKKPDVHALIEAKKEDANKLLDDGNKLDVFLQKCDSFFKDNEDKVGAVVYIPLYLDIIRCVINKTYDKITKKTLVLLTIALIYLVTPNEKYHKNIPILCKINHDLVVDFCTRACKHELEQFSNRKKLQQAFNAEVIS